MKVITANFMTCAVKGCKASPASFPLHFCDAELELQELDFEAEFIRNIIPRIDWDGLRVTANEVSKPPLFFFFFFSFDCPWAAVLTMVVLFKAGVPPDPRCKTRRRCA